MAEQQQEYGTKFNQPVTVGRIVHYVLKGKNEGQVRAAIVTRAWRDVLDGDPQSGMANLQLFLDGANDQGGNAWVGSALFSEEGEPGTWHWPPRVISHHNV